MYFGPADGEVIAREREPTGSEIAEERWIEAETFDGALREFAADLPVSGGDFRQVRFANPETFGSSTTPTVGTTHFRRELLNELSVLRRMGATCHAQPYCRVAGVTRAGLAPGLVRHNRGVGEKLASRVS